jgi:uncharacterized membrane protein
MMRRLRYVLVFGLLVWLTQYLFIANVPKLIFAIAKHRKPVDMNTVYHAGKTDATMRKVVLPNPDFIYSACFFDLSKKDLLITGQFPDTSQYCSLAFYGDDVQPYYVRNNLQGFKPNYSIRLSYVNREQRTLRAKTKQGVVLMRVLVTDSAQVANAKRIQQLFRVKEVPQSD